MSTKGSIPTTLNTGMEQPPALSSNFKAQSDANLAVETMLLDFITLFAQKLGSPNQTDDDGFNIMSLLASMLFGNEENPEEAYQDWHSTQTEQGWENRTNGIDRSAVDYQGASRLMRERAPALIQALNNERPNVNADDLSALSPRQQAVLSVMADACEASGANLDYMTGLWGYESSYGTLLLSDTGCQGDFQFSRVTMVEQISLYGDQMAQRLMEMGLEEDARAVMAMHEETKGFSGAQIRAYAGSSGGNVTQINALRNDPEISTYAAAYYTAHNARALGGLDMDDTKNWGYLYAGYNIGVGKARQIMAGNVATGWEVDANRGVAGGTTAAAQNADYTNAIVTRANSGAEYTAIAEDFKPDAMA